MNKTEVVKEGILREIEYGILNKRVYTENEIMKKYSVSRITVRRALYQLIEENIIKKIPGKKGYFINQDKITLKRDIHGCIGVLIHHSSEISHPYMHRFITSISEECERINTGYKVFNLKNGKRKGDEIDYILRIIKEKKLDGLLINCYLSDETLLKLENSEFPVVIVNNFLPGSDLPFIIPSGNTIRKTVRHLYRQGYRNLFFITGPQEQRLVHEGISAFISECKKLKIKIEMENIWEGNYNIEKARKGVEKFLKLKKFPMGILIDDDIIAASIMKLCKEKNISVPEDIGIVGVGGNEMSKFLTPPLSTILYPIEEMAKTGVNLLRDIIYHRKIVERTIVFDGKIIIRESSNARRKNS